MDTFFAWLESLQVSKYLASIKNADRIQAWLLNNPEVRAFLAEIDRTNLVKPKVNEKGFLVMSRRQPDMFMPVEDDPSHTGNSYQHRIPVVIVNIQGNEAEVARTDGRNFEEISYKVPHFPNPREKKTIVVPLDRISIVKQDQWNTYLNWIAYAVKKGANDSQVTIPKYFASAWPKIKQALINSLSNQQMQSKFRTTDMSFQNFISDYPEVNKKYRGGKGPEARIVINFPNGFKWVSLDKAACQAEGDAGGHCGNTVSPQPGENILSLRDAENRVYLTFIIDAQGSLIERKANGNKKPSRELHPYIIELLKNPLVKSIGPGKYLSEEDFQLYDLSHEDVAKLFQARPDLVEGMNKIDLMFIKYKGKEQKVIDRLQKKYPQLQQADITGYDPQQNSLILGNGETVIPNRDDAAWKSQIDRILASPSKVWFDQTGFTQEALKDLPVATITAFLDYFRKGTIKSNRQVPTSPKEAIGEKFEDFLMLFSTYQYKDKNFKHFIETCMKESYDKSAIEYINQDLAGQEMSDGTHYKIRRISSYVYAYRMLKTKYIKDFKGQAQDSEWIKLNVQPEPRIDYFVEAINKNLRMLYYPVY